MPQVGGIVKKHDLEKNGFTIIELMVTVAVIAILAAIAIPNFLGLQQRAKRKAMAEVAASSRGDLHNWLDAAVRQQKGVVDVNGDGIVTPGEFHWDLATLPDSWIQAYAFKIGNTPLSPWYNNKNLFTVGAPGTINPGQITLSTTNGGRSIKILAIDQKGSELFIETVSVD